MYLWCRSSNQWNTSPSKQLSADELVLKKNIDQSLIKVFHIELYIPFASVVIHFNINKIFRLAFCNFHDFESLTSTISGGHVLCIKSPNVHSCSEVFFQLTFVPYCIFYLFLVLQCPLTQGNINSCLSDGIKQPSHNQILPPLWVFTLLKSSLPEGDKTWRSLILVRFQKRGTPAWYLYIHLLLWVMK